jgi:hypothetical protein
MANFRFCGASLLVVDRILIRIPLKSDGALSGKVTSDACEFVYVEVYETGTTFDPLVYVIS